MSIVVNTNVSATTASLKLTRANDSRRKSLARLSSGNRIVSSADDAGGFAEAYKLPASVKRVEAVRNNVQNGVSYLQAQDGVLQVAGNVLDRMVELRTLVQYETKDTQNMENHFKEFLEVQRQFSHIYYEKCDGISLFAISSAKAVNNPPDLCPQLIKATTTNNEGNDFAVFSRTLYTHESGPRMDVNASLGVLNFETISDLGELDSRHIEDSDENSVNLANAADLNKGNYPTVSLGATTGGSTGAGGAGGGSTTPAPSGAALCPVGGHGELQVLSKAAMQTGGSIWRIRISDDMPGATGGLPSLETGPDIKDPLLTLFTMDLQNYITNYDYDFLETCAPDHLQVSLYASASAGTKFAPYLGSASNDVFATPGGNSGVQDVWDARAENGAEQSRLNMSSELLTPKQTNLEAAHGRIMDADIALESARFARHNVLVQASAAMTAQANQLTNVVLTLLG